MKAAPNDRALAREIAELRALKATRDAGNRAFFTRLRECETRGGWRALATTFRLFLLKTDLCDPAEYQCACAAMDAVPSATIDKIGLNAAAKIIALPVENRPAAVADLTKAAAKTGPLSKQKTNEVIRRHAVKPPERKPDAARPLAPVRTKHAFDPTATARELVARYGVQNCEDLIIALSAECARAAR